MKKLLLMCAVGLFASQGAVANAAPIDLGIWDPATCGLVQGGSATAELACLNQSVIPTYNLTHNPDLDPATFGTGNIDVGGEQTSITLTLGAYDYLKLKWDGMWQYYYVGDDTGPFTFNSTVFNQNKQPQALSHYTWFSPRTTSVPDGGATLGLLGAALFGLGVLRRHTI